MANGRMRRLDATEEPVEEPAKDELKTIRTELERTREELAMQRAIVGVLQKRLAAALNEAIRYEAMLGRAD